MTTLKTRRLILRPFEMKDAKELARKINDKTIARNTRVPYPYSIKDARMWLKKVIPKNKKNPPEKANFAITLNGELIGSVSFEKIEPKFRAEMGYWLAKDFRGRGLMPEAVHVITKFGFKKLKLQRIYAIVLSHNKASYRTLEKAGYKCEGFLRKNALHQGKLKDHYIFAKIK